MNRDDLLKYIGQREKEIAAARVILESLEGPTSADVAKSTTAIIAMGSIEKTVAESVAEAVAATSEPFTIDAMVDAVNKSRKTPATRGAVAQAIRRLIEGKILKPVQVGQGRRVAVYQRETINHDAIIGDALSGPSGPGKSEDEIAGETCLPAAMVARVLHSNQAKFIQGADYKWRKRN